VLEQNHRGIKGRYRSMRGFKAFSSAHIFCRAFDEVRVRQAKLARSSR
jgi:transposase-like protein